MIKRQARVLCALLLIACSLAALFLPCAASDSLSVGNGADLLLPERMKSNLLPILTGGSLSLFSFGSTRLIRDFTDSDLGSEYRVLFSEQTTSGVFDVTGNFLHSFKSPIATLAEQVVQETRGALICDYAKQFLGCRYVYGAQDPAYGFDCSGFTYYIYHLFGYMLNRGATGQLANGSFVRRSELQAGDLVFFGSGAIASHVGIYIGDGNFIHAANRRQGVIISSLFESGYDRTYLTARRIVE